MAWPTWAHGAFGEKVISLVDEAHIDIVECTGQTIIVRPHPLLTLLTTGALEHLQWLTFGIVIRLMEIELQAAVLQQTQCAVDELRIILLQVRSPHKGEHAHSERHSEEISAVVLGVIAHIHTHGLHIGTFQRNESITLLNRDAQNGAHAFGLPRLGVNQFEARSSGNGALQIVDREVFEIGLAQWQEEVGVVGITASHGEVSVEEAIAIHRIVELDERRLEEVSCRQPWVLVRGGGKDALLRWHGIVLGRKLREVIPVARDIAERRRARSIQMILKNQRQALTCGNNRWNDTKIATLDGCLNIRLTSAEEWNTQCLYALIRWIETHFEVLQGMILVLIVHGLRVADVRENLCLQCIGQQSEVGDEVSIDLIAQFLQIRESCEEGVDILHKLRHAHIEWTCQVEEVDVLFHRDGVLGWSRVWRCHKQCHGRCATDDLTAIDQEIKAVHAVEVEGLLILL